MDKLSNLSFVLHVKYLDHPEPHIAACVTTVWVSSSQTTTFRLCLDRGEDVDCLLL